MALVNSAFTVNVTPGAMPPIVHVSEYDVGRTYTVTINGENGSAFNIPTGTTATVEGTLNGVIGFTTDATISGSTVSFTLTESMTAKSGKAWCKIKLTLNDEPIQTCAFVLAVDRAGVEADTVIGAPGFEEQIQDAVDNYLEEHPVPTVTVDPTLTISGAAADAKVTGGKIGDLKSDLSVGRVEITKAVTWSNGYVNTSGVVKSSTLSGYAIVSMQAGEMVVIGTQNSNITIIGSTESESVAVGDSVTVIQTTSSTNQYEEYSYTATSDINIVICVLLSNYNLHFYYKLIHTEHTDDAFTPTIKNALLACFQNVAWANDNGLQYLNALNKALNGGKIPVTGGKFYPNLAVSASNNEASLYYDASTYNRLGFALDGVGDHPMKMSSQNPTTQDSFYPIPVPADALQFKATTPSSISISGYFFKWTGKWTVQLSLGNWSANYGGTTADISSINDGNLYFACGFRNSSNNGNITSVDTSTLQLEWLN